MSTTTLTSGPTAAPSLDAQPWWKDAVVYQVYLRSFADSNGDGDGDLDGLAAKMPYLTWLGVDALWITPHYPSPQADGGYDVADYTDVDPMYGNLEAFDNLVATAHAAGLKVLIDLVPNHTSSEHPWFQAALASPDAPERELYHFVKAPQGKEAPNNWMSCFGGPSWTLDPQSGEHYLHLFSPEQPDLNWRHPLVHREFERILRFWLDRGIDGVRIDVAAGLLKDPQMRDNPGTYAPTLMGHGPEQIHTWNQPGIHDIWKSWRAIVDQYPGDRALIGEVCLADLEAVASYCDDSALHGAFALQLLKTPWNPTAWQECLGNTLDAFAGGEGVPAWVAGNHDKDRAVTRFGGGELGVARSKGVAAFLTALPGNTYVYAGDELGLPNVDVAPQDRRDPIFVRSAGTRAGRDGCRTPMPWTTEGDTYGFTDASRGWLPSPDHWESLSVSAQQADDTSTLRMHRDLLSLRRQLRPGRGTAELSADEDRNLLSVTTALPDGRHLTATLNMGTQPQALADATAPALRTESAGPDGVLLPGETVWQVR